VACHCSNHSSATRINGVRDVHGRWVSC
jgi:hypothetical protein